jgi:hypothetical protein
METGNQTNVKGRRGYDLRVSDNDLPERQPEPSEDDERESFARRAEWWRLHYGDDAAEADEKIRDASAPDERPAPDDS